jgi:hypothetical protein
MGVTAKGAASLASHPGQLYKQCASIKIRNLVLDGKQMSQRKESPALELVHDSHLYSFHKLRALRI